MCLVIIHKQELYEDLERVYNCIDSSSQHSKYILKQILENFDYILKIEE